MKIDKIDVRGGQSTKLALVEVVGSDGTTGIGGTSAPAAAIGAIVNGGGGLSEVLVGADAGRPADRWHDLFVGWQAARGRAGEGGLAVNAMAAIDMAMWDLAGKADGVPVHRLLHDRAPVPVRVYGSATAFDVGRPMTDGQYPRKPDDRLIDECRMIVADGFDTIKLGWGNRFDAAAFDLLAAIRDTIGPDTGLALDFGCPAYWAPGWDAEAAIATATELARLDVLFWEEPLRPYDADGFGRLTRGSSVAIATGESLTTVHEFARLIADQRVDIVQPDAAQIGLTQFRRVTELAAAGGVRVIPHGPWHGVTVASHVHALTGAGHAPLVEYPAWGTWPADSLTHRLAELAHRDMVEHPTTARDGAITLTDRPGLGLGGFRHDAIEEFERLTAAAGR